MNDEQLRDLLERYQQGEREAGRELALLCDPLVSALANRLAYLAAEVDDYYQVGMIGLLRAAQRFKPEMQVKFTTFAVPWIRGEMLLHRRQYQSSVKVSRTLKEQAGLLNDYREKLTQSLGREPTVSELGKVMKITCEEVALIMESSLPLISLGEEPLLAKEGVTEEEELIDRLSLQDGIMQLTPMEREIISLRFFQELTQNEIAQTLSLTQRQVSRLEKRILWRLRQFMQC